MFKNIVRYCIIFSIAFALSNVAIASPHVENNKDEKTLKENASDDLSFYVYGDKELDPKDFLVPTILVLVETPEGKVEQLLHTNQLLFKNKKNTLWFHNDKRKTEDTKKKSESSTQAKQEEPKPKTRTL
tara:strand:+ start:6832 stop:7218 length:387 start_codon:yes stop_codon:yes gene_type:complete